MTKSNLAMRASLICAAALVLGAPSAMAQSLRLPPSSTPTSTPTSTPPAGDPEKTHRLVLQVDTNDPATMKLALNNATNVEQYYRGRGERVQIEIVTFGGGLNMLRGDTSPVKERIKAIAETSPSISFMACSNTMDSMRKAEDKAIPLIPQATPVPSGVVRVMELQEQGWTYVRP